MQRQQFIKNNTYIDHHRTVPEIKIHLSHNTDDMLAQIGSFHWSRVWPSGLHMARIILDHPTLVQDLTVVDVGCGSGIAAIAAAMSGAKQVTANDIDPWAVEATKLNAEINNVELETIEGDILDSSLKPDLIICGEFTTSSDYSQRLMSFVYRSNARCFLLDINK